MNNKTAEQLWQEPDWECPGCRFVNLPIRLKCRNCDEPRAAIKNKEPRPLLQACKEAMLAIKSLSFHVDGGASKELVAIYRMLQDAVQREEENS